MASLGITTKVAGGRLEVVVVGIERSQDDVKAEPALRFRGDPNEDFPQQLRAAANAVRPLLAKGMEVTVVASFDYRQTQRIQDWVKVRLRAEGALAVMAREHSSRVEIMTGRDMGVTMGSSKDELAELAAQTLAEHEGSAVMAALTAERLAAVEEDSV